jgi:hypothetical protein
MYQQLKEILGKDVSGIIENYAVDCLPHCKSSWKLRSKNSGLSIDCTKFCTDNFDKWGLSYIETFISFIISPRIKLKIVTPKSEKEYDIESAFLSIEHKNEHIDVVNEIYHILMTTQRGVQIFNYTHTPFKDIYNEICRQVKSRLLGWDTVHIEHGFILKGGLKLPKKFRIYASVNDKNISLVSESIDLRFNKEQTVLNYIFDAKNEIDEEDEIDEEEKEEESIMAFSSFSSFSPSPRSYRNKKKKSR